MRVHLRMLVGMVAVCSLVVSLLAGASISSTAYAASVSITKSGGWHETAYVEWQPVNQAEGYRVYVKAAGASDSQYTQLDNELLRQYVAYWRADAIGLSAGNYVLKVEALLPGGTTSAVTGTIVVKAHDRSGFSFAPQSPFGTGSGAYQDNGRLKPGAQVIYVTSETAQTVKLDVRTSSSGKTETGTGIAHILNLRQKGHDTTPLAIRFIGKVTDADMSGQLNSNGYLQVKGKNNYSQMNITLEGVGEDAVAYRWGILLRAVGNVEVRNLGLMLFPDDGISMDTGNANVWVHHNDIFYGTAGSDEDQAKGDGATDLKKGSTYITLSYNHYWDYGKTALVGLNETEEFFVTFHHNWFDHSDSRHPRIRVASVHVYNNYFDGISKYGVGVTTGASAFVEANYFRNAKYPMLSSRQGTDVVAGGIFSGENGGVIKAYNNIVQGASGLIYANSNAGTSAAHATSFDAYLASYRHQPVPSSFKSLVGGQAYNNFDTSIHMGVDSAAIDAVNNVENIVTANAGRLNKGDFTWSFNNAIDDTSYSINTGLMNKIQNYTSTLISIGGNPAIVNPTPPVTTAKAHNFTASGKTSDYFSINGNLSTSKGTVHYNGLTLTQCLKIETATSITFTTTAAATLTLVLNSPDGTKIKVNGVSHPMSGGIVSVALAAGTHTITKDNIANLFYLSVE